MNHKEVPLDAGLYIVSTPIGNARDITLRALDTLASADLVAAEDTRTARRLMEIHGVPIKGRKFVAYHDHSGAVVREKILQAVRDGQSVAYVSEAGTPLVADPGYQLARAMHDHDLLVRAVPGASALLGALALGGMPTDRFQFVGFLPNAGGARRAALSALRDARGTLVLYESPKRLAALLLDICEIMGRTREIAICRELTKKFEEVLRGTSGNLLELIEESSVKGEVVVLIGEGEIEAAADELIETALIKAMETMRVKDAATAVAGALGRPRREVYQMALRIRKQ